MARDEAMTRHGRHCDCTPCRTTDWTDPSLAPCGWHPDGCPPADTPDPVAALAEALDTPGIFEDPLEDDAILIAEEVLSALTAAGRALLDALTIGAEAETLGPRTLAMVRTGLATDIAAIEAEALPTVDELAAALVEAWHAGLIYTGPNDFEEAATAIRAALQAARETR